MTEAFRRDCLTEINPEQRDLSPWERRLAINAAHEVQWGEAAHQRRRRQNCIEDIERKMNIQINEKRKHYLDWPNPY